MTDQDCSTQDEFYMRRALGLAARGEGWTSPNPMVGAVLVDSQGRIVGEGWHRRAGAPHAEVEALRQAGKKAKGCTLYVTLEPCNHMGRTPPCTLALLEAGVRKVVCAMADPNPKVAGGGADFLRSRGLEVMVGLCEDQAKRQNAFFIKHVTSGLPFVISKCAATLDGKIATMHGDSKWISGPQARASAHALRHAVDAICVGVGTVAADNPSLTARLAGRKTRDPLRVVLDSHLSMDPGARMLRQDSDSDTLIICLPDHDKDRRLALEQAGARVEPVGPDKFNRPDFRKLCRLLGGRNITSLLIEGGGRVHAAAFAARMVDRVRFYYAPKIMGGDGVPMLSGPGPKQVADCVVVENMSVETVGQDIMVEGDIRYP